MAGRKKPANLGRKRVVFRLRSPAARSVAVTGAFCEWGESACPLRDKGDGTWERIMFLAPGRYEYRFVVDGRWCSDPANPERVPNPYGSHNSVLVVAP